MRPRLIPAVLAVLALPLPGCAASPAPDFAAHWRDGRAELDGYRYQVRRYGEERRGRAVAIFVTEPFSRARNVKVEDADRDPADTFEALKLNLVRDFQTGIYDYRTMVSLFVASADLTPRKLAFTSSEWCGQLYEELDLRGGRVDQHLASYFEDESRRATLPIPPGGIAEEQLFLLLRGLRGEWLAPGAARTVPWLDGAFARRLTHTPLAWTQATVTRAARTASVRVPAGRFECDLYTVAVAGGRTGRFAVERAHPRRMVRWSWETSAPGMRGDGAETAELTGTTRTPYWREHREGDERRLAEIGVSPLFP